MHNKRSEKLYTKPLLLKEEKRKGGTYVKKDIQPQCTSLLLEFYETLFLLFVC